MNTPFTNDMFSMVYKAFKRLYPDKDCECYWQPEKMIAEDGLEVFGMTHFCSDGSVYVDVSANLRIVDAVEILAHELAHVAVGPSEEHGEAWENAFDAIHREYNTVGNEIFGNEGSAVEVISGKAYVRDAV